MSCKIELKSSVSDLKKIKKVLFPDEEVNIDNDSTWMDTDAWAWKTDYENEEEESSKDNVSNENWIQSCLISSSPQAEILVIVHEDRFVVLSGKWEKCNQQERMKYHMTYPTNISPNGVGNKITSVLCIPIKSSQKSSQGMPDWICIFLGLESGNVHMYTTDGTLLIVEAFHDEPIQQLQYNSSLNAAHQEVSVLYKKVLVLVEAVGLFNSLKACRSHLAKGRAFMPTGELSFQHLPLSYKKFGLQEQERVNECVLLGTCSPTHFDHLVTASVAGGFQARFNNSPPAAAGIFSLGILPYCAWHYAIEGSAAPLLTDVAYALASKVTSKIFAKTNGWLGWGGASKTDSAAKHKEKQIIEPAIPVYPKHGLADALREALSVSVSSDQKLAAVTDSLGRVIVIDLQRGIAVRIWKGYRDAQCGWVTSWEEHNQGSLSSTNTSEKRVVDFLVIYIAKRGLLEVWTAQQGTRVAAFNCSKGAKMLNTRISCLEDKDLPQCCIVCPDGQIFEIVVPFQCALKGDCSKKARDLQLLQQFRIQLERTDGASSFDLLSEISHASVAYQGLDMLLDCRNPINADAFVKYLQSVVAQYDQAEALDAESRLLLSRCKLLYKLALVYVQLKEVEKLPPDYETVSNASPVSFEEIAETLHLDVNEVSRTFQRCSAQDFDVGTDDMGSDVPSLEIHSFLSSFELFISHGIGDSIRIKSSLSASRRRSLSNLIWGTCFSRGIHVIDELASIIKDSLVVSEDLVSLLIDQWFRLSSSAASKILHFHKLLRMLSDADEGCTSQNAVSNPECPNPWWQNIGYLLSKSNNLPLATVAALVCRSVIAEREKRKILETKEKNEGGDVMGEWEDMSIDMVQWNVLSKQLEDLSVLFRLIRYAPIHLRESQSQLLEFPLTEASDDLDFTLSSILQKGRGAVSELVARWITQNLLEVSLLFTDPDTGEGSHQAMNIDQDAGPEHASEANIATLECSEEVVVIQGLFRDLNQQLSHSTERNVLSLNVAVEYAALWIKNPKHMKLLERSLKSVSQLGSNLLRHGICRTLWIMSFSSIFHDLAVMMDKSGRLQKNFSSRKINLPSPDQVTPFLEITMQLLDAAVTSAMSCELEPPPLIRYDDLWPTCDGATPILEVAVRQRLLNIDLALLHHQLAHVLYLIASLEIKGIHAFSLFDQRVGRFAFFKDLHSYPPLPTQDCDPTVTINRLQFLKQVISKAVDLMECNLSAGLDFVNQAIKLGYEWIVDVDELRIKYVELLFHNHMDHLAVEVLPSIGAGEKLAPVLLIAAGKRLKSLLKPRDTSSLSPMTVAWLNGFSEDTSTGPLYEFKPAQTLSLLVEAIRRMPSDCNDQVIANELHATLMAIQDRVV